MSASLAIDHVVIRVDDLDAASQVYRARGLSVSAGGQHPAWGSANAIIPFDDGSYLELITFAERASGTRPERLAALRRQGRSRLACRWLSWAAAPPGLVDFAMGPREGALMAALDRGGLDVEGPLAGQRKRPDGATVAWEMGLPDDIDLPFFCADVTPRRLRVPDGSARDHDSDATGIAEITVAVGDIDAAAARYETLLGVRGVRADGRPRVVFGRVAITSGAAVAAHLKQRGPGPCRVVLAGPEPYVLRPTA